MVGSQKDGKARDPLIWALVLFLAIAWHVAWWMWLSPVPVEARLVLPETPTVSYMPVAVDGSKGEGIQAKMQTLWSPALFSLPSQVGFSRTILTNEIGVRPPLAMPDGASRFLERGTSASASRPAEGAAMDSSGVLETIEAYTACEDLPAIFTSLSVTGVIMKVDFFEGLVGRQFEQMELPQLPSQCREKPWEAIAYLDVDEEGRVRHVFLERRSPSEDYDAELVQNMLSWRMRNPGDVVTGRIILRCFASTRTASKQSGGGGP